MAVLPTPDARRNAVFLEAGASDTNKEDTAGEIHANLHSCMDLAHGNGREIIAASGLRGYRMPDDLRQKMASSKKTTLAKSAGADAVIDLPDDNMPWCRDRRSDPFRCHRDLVHPAGAGYVPIARKVVSVT